MRFLLLFPREVALACDSYVVAGVRARGGQLSRPTETSSDVSASISSSDLCVESDGIHADGYHPLFSENIGHMKFACVFY